MCVTAPLPQPAAPRARADAADTTAQESRCPRCGAGFHCGAADAGPCACATVTLPPPRLAELQQRFSGCLCLGCLRELAGAADAGTADPAAPTLHGRVRVLHTEQLSARWNRVDSTRLEYRRRDGRWQTLQREAVDHGHAAAVLLFDPARRTVVLLRQFRWAAMVGGCDELMIEVPAGLLDGDSPADCVRAEALQEVGWRVREPRFVFDVYSSPGSLTERVACFVAEVDAADRVGAGGGLEHEGEDIEVLELPFDEALAMIADGRIRDAKTMLLLQYAALHLPALRGAAG